MADRIERQIKLDLGCARCQHPTAHVVVAGDLEVGGKVGVTVICPNCGNRVNFGDVAVEEAATSPSEPVPAPTLDAPGA